jgi:uncharacterized membrane protein
MLARMRKPSRPRREPTDDEVSLAHARVARSLLLMPLTGLVLGAEGSGLTSRLVEHGFDDQFAFDLLQQLEHGGSAIVLLTPATTRDRVLAEIARLGGTVLRTSGSVEADVLPLIEKEHSAG